MIVFQGRRGAVPYRVGGGVRDILRGNVRQQPFRQPSAATSPYTVEAAVPHVSIAPMLFAGDDVFAGDRWSPLRWWVRCAVSFVGAIINRPFLREERVGFPEANTVSFGGSEYAPALRWWVRLAC